MQATLPRRSATFTAAAPPPLQSFAGDLFSDSRFHGYQGPSRNVRLPRATTSAGGTVAKSEDGVRCVVAGRECSSICSFSVSCLLTMVSNQPCASFVCRTRKTRLPRTKRRPLGSVGTVWSSPRTSGMEVGSRSRVRAPT